MGSTGTMQAYQIATAGSLPQGVVMATTGSAAISSPQQLSEEAARKRELRLLKNRYGLIYMYIATLLPIFILMMASGGLRRECILTVVYPPSGLMSAFPLFPAKKRRFVLYDFGTP